MGIHQLVAVALFVLPGVAESQIRIKTSAATGLGPQEDVGRLDPSDILRFGDQHVVLYTRVEESDPLYPAPYAGEIWWASSTDVGHSWTEQGRLLGASGGSDGDALGVFDPNVLRIPGQGLVLFYSGIGPEFNFRFEEQSRPEETQLFRARLQWQAATRQLVAERDPESSAILSPVSPDSRAFDSSRVRRAKPFLRKDQVHLYYRGTSAQAGTRGEALGLATGSASSFEFRRVHEGRAVLPFRGDALLMEYSGGVLALFTGGDRGAWWAADGEHFAPLDVEIRGRVNSPGLDLEVSAANGTGSSISRWGLHVARENPDPWLERFQLTIQEALPTPADASRPEPGQREFVVDGTRRTWEEQHLALRDTSAKANAVFLGGTLVQGFLEDGQEPWEELFAGYRAANLGMRGDNTSNLLWRVDHGALPMGQQRLILIHVSSEQTLAIGDQAITRGVDTLLRRIRARKPGAQIWVLPPHPTPWMTEAELAAIRKATATLALFLPQPRVQIVDPWIEFYDDSGQLNKALFAPVGEGLSPEGYRILAETLQLDLPPAAGGSR